jgi:hypothetical protein
MTDDAPNEAYEVVPSEPGPHGPPKGWWTVKRNRLPVRHFPGKEKAQRYRQRSVEGALKRAAKSTIRKAGYYCPPKFQLRLESTRSSFTIAFHFLDIQYAAT